MWEETEAPGGDPRGHGENAHTYVTQTAPEVRMNLILCSCEAAALPLRHWAALSVGNALYDN